MKNKHQTEANAQLFSDTKFMLLAFSDARNDGKAVFQNIY